MLPEEAEELTKRIADELGWDGEFYQISAFQKLETQSLCRHIMDFLQTLPNEEEVEQEEDDQVEFKWDTYHRNTMEQAEFDDDDDDWDDEDDHPNVVYTKE